MGRIIIFQNWVYANDYNKGTTVDETNYLILFVQWGEALGLCQSNHKNDTRHFHRRGSVHTFVHKP